MNQTSLATGLSRSRKSAGAKVFALAAVMTLAGAPIQAREATANFDVVINLKAAVPQTGLCTNSNGTGVFGATVTVVCGIRSNPPGGSFTNSPDTGSGTQTPAASTGAATDTPGASNGTSLPLAGVPRSNLPIPSAAYRFVTFISGNQLPGIVDAYTSGGTSTAFRVVSLADREYIEMTVGW